MYSETKIAIPIFQRNKEDILKVAEECIIKGADILELRIDGMDNPNPKIVKEIITDALKKEDHSEAVKRIE